MIRGKPHFAIVAAILVHAGAAEAQLEDTPSLSFDGFATLGVVHSDEDQADFVSSVFAPEGAGQSETWSAEVDSRLGLQLTARFTPRLTGVVQVVAEQRFDDTYAPTLEWANVKFDVTPELSVRAGRAVLPNFLNSEFRKVGFAIPWIRPPQEVYRLSPVTNVDGVEVGYRTRFAGFTNTLRGSYGQKDEDLPGGAEVEARDLVTVVDTLEYGPTTLFASYANARVTSDAVAPLFDGFRQFGPEGRAIAERFDIDDKRVEIVSVGVRHDPGDWFVMGEWARRTFVGDTRGWYVTGGYRVGAFTPYVTFARAKISSATSDPGLSLAGLPPPLAAVAGALNAGLNQLLGSVPAQKSLSIGVRWDFAPKASVKVQFDRLDLDAGSPGVLVNTLPGFRAGGSVSLFSVALDTVF